MKTKKLILKYGGKKHYYEARVCSSFFSKLRGLMFRSRNYSTPLLFVFSRPSSASIHSLFCRKFLAVWMLDDKIVDKKIVESWKFSVTPKEKFNFLLEVPITPTR